MIKKKNISQEDINTWKNYIKNPTDIIDKDNIKKDSQLRYSVPEYIKADLDLSKYVMSITSAAKRDGGDGAIIIKLKKL